MQANRIYTNEKKYYPPMHSSEHILNRTMIIMFRCERSFNSHIERKKSKCDYHFNRALSKVEEQEIMEKVNAVIAQNLNIREEFISLKEAKESFNLSRLPKESCDKIRIVKIGNYDTCPCIGDHVENTSEIGVFKIISSDFENGVLRIRFKLQKGRK